MSLGKKGYHLVGPLATYMNKNRSDQNSDLPCKKSKRSRSRSRSRGSRDRRLRHRKDCKGRSKEGKKRAPPCLKVIKVPKLKSEDGHHTEGQDASNQNETSSKNESSPNNRKQCSSRNKKRDSSKKCKSTKRKKSSSNQQYGCSEQNIEVYVLFHKYFTLLYKISKIKVIFYLLIPTSLTSFRINSRLFKMRYRVEILYFVFCILH